MDFLTEYNEAEVMASIREEGWNHGIDTVIDLYNALKSEGRDDDVERLMTDAAYREQLLAERRVATV